MKKNLKNNKPYSFVLLVVFFLGLITVLFSLNVFYEVSKVGDWKSTEGKILSSYIGPYYTSAPNGKLTISHTRNFVSYSYIVNNQTFFSDKVSFSLAITDPLSKYKLGDILTVYYDPNKISDSVLDRDYGFIDVLLTLLGLSLILVSILGYYKLMRKKQ